MWCIDKQPMEVECADCSGTTHQTRALVGKACASGEAQGRGRAPSWSGERRNCNGALTYCPRGSKTLSGGVRCLSVTQPWAVTQSRTAKMVMA